MFAQGESLLFPLMPRRHRGVPFSLDFGWSLRDEAAGDAGAGAGGDGGKGAAATATDAGGEPDVAKMQRDLNAARGAQKEYDALMNSVGAKNSAELKQRVADLLEAENRSADALPEPTRQTAGETVSRTPEPWTPEMGAPEMPDDSEFEQDRYAELTEKGSADRRAALKDYNQNLARWAHFDARQTEARGTLPANLEAEIGRLPENWQQAPTEWAFDKPYAEVLSDLLGGHAHAGLGEGIVATPDQLGSSRAMIEALIRHIVVQETAAADAEAGANREGQPPEGGTGTPSGEGAGVGTTSLRSLTPASSKEDAKEAIKEKLKAGRRQ